MTGIQLRATGVFLGAVWLASHPLASRGDKIVLKSGNAKYGTVENETDASVTIVDELGRRTTLMRTQIKEIVRAGVKEEELELLRPSVPDRYFEIGSRYADDADDPKVRACAQHLLMVAIDLDPEKYTVPGHLLLARLADGPERAHCLLAVLRHEPKQEIAREQLASLRNELKRDRSAIDDLCSEMRAAQQGRPGALINSIRHDSKYLAEQLAPLWPRATDDLAKLSTSPDVCTGCKGNGVRRCDGGCVKGKISCKRCKGAGNVSRVTSVMGPQGGSFSVGNERCPSCDGRARWTCSRCKGLGNIPCKACTNKPKVDTVTTDVKQKIDSVLQVLSRPPDSSWARELIAEDRSPFQGLRTASFDVGTRVNGRYYRRGGEWQDRL